MSDQQKPMKLISGNSHPALASAIAKALGVELVKRRAEHFADGEIFVEIQENMRGQDVFVIQSPALMAQGSPNDYVMELLVLMDALRRSSAHSINVVLPYFPYARQDRKTGSRTPITAKLMANMITAAGADRVLTLDLHASQIQGFFDIPVDNLFATPVFEHDIKTNFKTEGLVIVSPDMGGTVRARGLAKKFNSDIAIIDKRREQAGQSEVMNIVGDVRNQDCILIDDIVDSAGTLCNAAEALMGAGAKSVRAYLTHAVLSGEAVGRIEKSSLQEVVVTDSIARLVSNKIRVVSVAPLLARAIKSIYKGESVSSLFDSYKPS